MRDFLEGAGHPCKVLRCYFFRDEEGGTCICDLRSRMAGITCGFDAYNRECCRLSSYLSFSTMNWSSASRSSDRSLLRLYPASCKFTLYRTSGLPFASGFQRRARSAAEIVVRVLTAIPFLVEFFINMQFKTLYDISTVLFGGGDALTGFSSTIRGLIFSASRNRSHHRCSFSRRHLRCKGAFGKFNPVIPDRWKVGLLAVLMPVAFFSNVIMISLNPASKAIHNNEYTFPAAAEKFGLSEALALDIRSLLRG